MQEVNEKIRESLRRVGIGPNDFYVEIKDGVFRSGVAVLKCNLCGVLTRVLVDEDGDPQVLTELEGIGSEHVRSKAVEEEVRHWVKISPE